MPSLISFKCPTCGSALNFGDGYAGVSTLCPECNDPVRVPSDAMFHVSITDAAAPPRPRPRPREEPVDVGEEDLVQPPASVGVGTGFRFGLGFGLAMIAIPVILFVALLAACGVLGALVSAGRR